jgi:hypothetical protein
MRDMDRGGRVRAQSKQSASFSPVVRIGTPLTPHPQASVPPFCWEVHTRWRDGGCESPNSDEGTYTVVLFILFIYTNFVGARI